jgi:hypothetical protein
MNAERVFRMLGKVFKKMNFSPKGPVADIGLEKSVERYLMWNAGVVMNSFNRVSPGSIGRQRLFAKRPMNIVILYYMNAR